MLRDEKKVRELIDFIETTVQPESISNIIVAYIFDHLFSVASEVPGLSNDIAQLVEADTALSARIHGLTSALDAETTGRRNADSDLSERISDEEITRIAAVKALRDFIVAVSDKADLLSGSIGKATSSEIIDGETVTTPGIAPLNEQGVIAAKFLPGFVDDVMDFDGFVTWEGSFAGKEYKGDLSEVDHRVLFNPGANRFILEVTPVSSTGKPQTPEYYPVWTLDENQLLCLGAGSGAGFSPLKSKTYYCPTTTVSYRWNGTSMAPCGSHLELGKEVNTAYPGDAGKLLEETKADRTELSGVLSRDPEEEFEAAEPDFLTLMLRKNEQVLTDEERRQVLENLGRPDRAGLLEHAKTVFDIRVQQSGASWFSVGLVRDTATGLWQFDAVHDLTDEDVIMALLFWPMMRGRTYTRCFQRSPLRFAVLHNDADGAPQTGTDNGQWLFAGSDVEEVVMSGGPGSLSVVGAKTFEYAAKLRVIRGFIPCINVVPSFAGCTALEDVTLDSVCKSVSFADCPHLSLNSITRMVSAGSSGITITLHADAFARLSDELMAAAAEKNITLTTP